MGRGFTRIDADTSKSLLLSRIIECFSAEFRIRPEVQDKTHLKLSGFEVIENLSFMFDADSLGSLNFYNIIKVLSTKISAKYPPTIALS
jgi:hypothetical protein